MKPSVWLVRWRLMGSPQMIPEDMLRTIPDEAFDALQQDGATDFQGFNSERLRMVRGTIWRNPYLVRFRGQRVKETKGWTVSTVEEARAIVRRLSRENETS